MSSLEKKLVMLPRGAMNGIHAQLHKSFFIFHHVTMLNKFALEAEGCSVLKFCV
jgi:hypothetical protein